METFGYKPGQKHPNFDEYFPKYHRFLWWCALKCAKKLHGNAEDYLAYLIFRFNRALKGFDPAKGKLTTYFMRRLYLDAFRQCRNDSEQQSLTDTFLRRLYNSKNKSRLFKNKRIDLKNFLDSQGCPTQIPFLKITSLSIKMEEERQDYHDEFLKCFNNNEEMWRYVCKNMNDRQLAIIKLRFFENNSLQSIADKYQVSKQRAKQLLDKITDKIKDKVLDIDWNKKFKINESQLMPKEKYDMFFGESNLKEGVKWINQ